MWEMMHAQPQQKSNSKQMYSTRPGPMCAVNKVGACGSTEGLWKILYMWHWLKTLGDAKYDGMTYVSNNSFLSYKNMVETQLSIMLKAH